MTPEAILVLHMVDLHDKIDLVTRFYPASANYPLPAQKAMPDPSCLGVSGWAGSFKAAVLATDWLAARVDPSKMWLAEADASDKTAGCGVHAPPHL